MNEAGRDNTNSEPFGSGLLELLLKLLVHPDGYLHGTVGARRDFDVLVRHHSGRHALGSVGIQAELMARESGGCHVRRQRVALR